MTDPTPDLMEALKLSLLKAGSPRVLAKQVLDLELPPDHTGARTVREYLIKMFADMWRLGVGGLTRRRALYRALVRAGMVDGTFDEAGDLGEDFDWVRADELILAAIAALGEPQ